MLFPNKHGQVVLYLHPLLLPIDFKLEFFHTGRSDEFGNINFFFLGMVRKEWQCDWMTAIWSNCYVGLIFFLVLLFSLKVMSVLVPFWGMSQDIVSPMMPE